MHDDADAPQARTPFQPAEHVRIELQSFLGDRQHEFSWLQDKRLTCFYNHSIHDALERRLRAQVNIWIPAVLEDVELVP
jgi:hypothetical protein